MASTTLLGIISEYRTRFGLSEAAATRAFDALHERRIAAQDPEAAVNVAIAIPDSLRLR